ncbi:MAG: hypothetical protein F4179_01230 [Gammaproteobacteria bacterium]|nr:hypothetical protein [Gammaproteobacteria bacterium]MYF60292.1 hypothetical protein [Gammaproteobacteria bacterium]MYI22674.1 hypothetical protein [Gammaproteobacteria bacterium]
MREADRAVATSQASPAAGAASIRLRERRTGKTATQSEAIIIIEICATTVQVARNEIRNAQDNTGIIQDNIQDGDIMPGGF